MMIIIFEINCFQKRNLFLNFAPFCSVCRPVTQSHWEHVPYVFYWSEGCFSCLSFFWWKVDFIIFWKYTHRFLVVIKVCYLIFVIVISSSHINKFYRPSSVALLYSIMVYWAICMFLILFDRFIIWWPIKSRMWMSGVGTLCVDAHYRASLFILWSDYCE